MATENKDDFLTRRATFYLFVLWGWGIFAAVTAVSGGPEPFTFWFIGLAPLMSAPAAYLISRWQPLHRRGLIPVVVITVIAWLVAVVALVV